MSVSQTKNNLRWSFFVFALLCFVSSGLYVLADEQSLSDTTVFNDADADGLSNDEEKIYGTDADVADTDGDGYSDGVEVEGGFDPVKPAPGDRITPDESMTDSGESDDMNTATPNLTNLAAEKLATVIAEKGESESPKITTEDLDTVLADVMASSSDEVVLPDINTSTIKIKELPKNLSDEERADQNRQNVIEYLTLVSYILITNAPVEIRDTSALEAFTLDAGNKIVLGLASGNLSYLDTLEERTSKALEEMKDIEVPESMVPTHVKALKMLTFASSLKQTLKTETTPDDPLGQMYGFSKVQGLLASLSSFMGDTENILANIGVKNIPLDL